ncbi:hypothetical protein Scep_023616 [Stephania cephalantha]|uniref:Calponin-homology (CH) domain-containing protein n=1 Tax=Stephania cephalantha TaxID=152367 RepID=A0AAP0HXG0_9MAGN
MTGRCCTRVVRSAGKEYMETRHPGAARDATLLAIKYLGLVFLEVLDKASPRSVNWKHASKPPIKMPFRKLENCNQVVNIGKELNFALVNVAENDIVQGNKKLILGVSFFPSSEGLEVIWSSVVKIGQSLYLEAPRMDPFRPDQKTLFEFVAHNKGFHKFCFNKSPYHETVEFDVQVNHFTHQDQHAKDEHVNPLLEHIAKLEDAIYNIQFEQHWLEAQTDRQAESM